MNLQTGEVYLRDRMLMPVPTEIGGHPSFEAAFRGASLFCAVRDVRANSKTITLMHRGSYRRRRGRDGA